MHIDIGIVTLIWVSLQILISYCKFLMSRPLNEDFTIIIFKVIHKNAQKYGNLFYESDVST